MLSDMNNNLYILNQWSETKLTQASLKDHLAKMSVKHTAYTGMLENLNHANFKLAQLEKFHPWLLLVGEVVQNESLPTPTEPFGLFP